MLTVVFGKTRCFGSESNEMRILIADDNALVRKALHQLLEEQEGWSVCGEAQDGYEAVERARQSRPDLVLLDLAMPHLSGLQAASRISALLPTTPMIMLTLYDSALIQTEAKKVGILQVIPKTDGKSVIETIKSLLQKIPVRDVNIAEVPTNHPQLASEQCGAASSDHQAAENDYALG